MTELERHLMNGLQQLAAQYETDMNQLETQNLHLQQQVQTLADQVSILVEQVRILNATLAELAES